MYEGLLVARPPTSLYCVWFHWRNKRWGYIMIPIPVHWERWTSRRWRCIYPPRKWRGEVGSGSHSLSGKRIKLQFLYVICAYAIDRSPPPLVMRGRVSIVWLSKQSGPWWWLLVFVLGSGGRSEKLRFPISLAFDEQAFEALFGCSGGGSDSEAMAGVSCHLSLEGWALLELCSPLEMLVPGCN